MRGSRTGSPDARSCRGASTRSSSPLPSVVWFETWKKFPMTSLPSPYRPLKVRPTCPRPWSTFPISLVKTRPGRCTSTEARSPLPTLVGQLVRNPNSWWYANESSWPSSSSRRSARFQACLSRRPETRPWMRKWSSSLIMTVTGSSDASRTAVARAGPVFTSPSSSRDASRRSRRIRLARGSSSGSSSSVALFRRSILAAARFVCSSTTSRSLTRARCPKACPCRLRAMRTRVESTMSE